MSFRYPVPDEEQSERLIANSIDPREFFVRHSEEDGTLHLQNYKTGDEVQLRINPLKRRN